MEPKLKSRLTSKRDAYRLWFEYLRVARQSSKQTVKSALVVSKPFYSSWQMDKGDTFNIWWKSHGHLFEEKYVIRQLMAGEMPLDADALILEIPLTQSPTTLTKRAKAFIHEAFEAREQTQQKSKARPSAYYRLSEGSEPKLVAVREMLSVYRDVYLKNQQLRGDKLLAAVHSYYLGRKNKNWAKVPMALRYDSDGDKARAMRNLRRYIQKAEKVVLNVAKGQFPGEY